MSAKSDVVVKLSLVFFISLLSFSIGTFVGKKYSDNQHKLAALEPSESRETREVASIVDENGKVEPAVKDDEIAKIASEFADDESQATKPDATSAVEGKKEEGEAKPEAKTEAKADVKEEKALEAKAVVAEEEASPTAKTVAEGKAPKQNEHKAKAEKENREPSSLPKDVAGYAVGKFTVQIGSYLTEKEAHERADVLKKQGYSAFYVAAVVKGTPRYRVNVGLFPSESEAKTYRMEFMSKAKMDAIVQKVN